MSTVTIDQTAVQPHVRAVRDGRPPEQTWRAEPSVLDHQPALVFASDSEDRLAAPQPATHLVHVVRSPWAVGPAKNLPDARGWSASLALAVAEALQGRRPVGQLSRWVDERVLATLTVHRRQRGQTSVGRVAPAPTRPAVLRSVHLQFPTPDAVEVSAHVHVDGRSSAFAFRLDAWYDRWLCTALELGPRAGEV